MRFDLSSAKTNFDAAYGAGNWSITSVTLQLTATNPASNAIFNSNTAGLFNVSWMQNDSWAEGTGNPSNSGTGDGVTFNALGSFLSGADQSAGNFTFAGGISGTASYSLSTGSGLLSDISAGSTASLRVSAADSSVSYLFNSRSIATVTSRPALIVTAIPEPVQLGALILPILAMRRRRELL
jgi:hypothetical protein